MTQMSVGDAMRLALERHQAGELDDAEHVYRAVLESQPTHAEAMHLLGVIEQQRGRHVEAIALFERAIQLRPDAADFRHNLGNSLVAIGKHDAAVDAFAEAVRIDPQLFEARHNLGSTLMLGGRSNEAVEAFTAAIKLNPASPDAHNNLALALKDQGDIASAIAEATEGARLRPSDHHAQSNRLYALHFSPRYDAAAIFREHRAWAERYALPLAPREPMIPRDRSSDRKLRIGYVSPDLRNHPVGRSLLPMLQHHDRNAFEIVCYSDAQAEDDLSTKLRESCSTWRRIAGVSDEQLAKRIQDDQIDILVDLTLHMRGNRLLVFARKPAPAQATFVGYPATTGLPQMDYRITDRYLDPPGETESFNSEKLIRLQHSFWCYAPEETIEPCIDPPFQKNGHITFGSFNNPCKMNDSVIDAWSAILRAVPTARLLLYVVERNNIGARFRSLFAKRDIDPARLDFSPRRRRIDYLRQHQHIDIALDPFPYNGHMTSCDALWMAVPTVTLRGQTSVSRGGESLLANLKLDDLVAGNIDQYIKTATHLAADAQQLTELHRTLRQRMQTSPLMDAAAFTRDVESLYRQMWREMMLQA